MPPTVILYEGHQLCCVLECGCIQVHTVVVCVPIHCECVRAEYQVLMAGNASHNC